MRAVAGVAKRVLHRIALAGDWAVDRLRPNRVPERPVLDAYRGFATPEGLELRARVLASLRRTTPEPGQSRWQNLREMASLFLTREVAEVTVIAPTGGVSGLSDEEGYVTLILPGDHAPGRHEIALEIAGDPESRVLAPALVPSSEARIGTVSDIDDTMMHTGAYSLARNLWTTFTGTHHSRHVFPDSVALMDHLAAGGRNPVFYVSSSPWNLHAFLEKVFARAGLAEGPIFLRDYGIAEDQFITRGHGSHKGEAIDRILAANPGLPFVLVGDTGQKDAAIYRDACRRHPGRIRAVVLREPRPGAGAAAEAAMTETEAMGVTVLHGPDFAGVPSALSRAGLEP